MEEAAGVREAEVSRGNSSVKVRGRATGDGDGAVWILRHKRGARGHVHVFPDGSRNDARFGNCADLAGICGSAGSQQVRPAGAYISHFQQPSLAKVALDVEVPLLRVGRAETSNGEEEEAGERSPAGTLENGRACCSVKTNECGDYLIGRKRKSRVGQYTGKWILRRHGEWRRADGFRERQSAGGLQKGLVGDALVVNAVAGTNHSFLIAEYVPGIADPGAKFPELKQVVSVQLETPGVPTFGLPAG